MDIVTRAEWGARPPKRVHHILTPTPKLWLHHTAGNERSAAGMRQIQAYHMDVKGWSDIAYSFVIDPNLLLVYEGRGAGIAGGHTAGHNTTSHAICVMGRYDEVQPTEQLLHLIADLVRHGHARGWWPAQFTGGHRDASGASTACPGRWLHALIPTINAWAVKTPAPARPLDIPENTMPLPSEVKFTWSLLDLDDCDDRAQLLLSTYGQHTDGNVSAWRKDLAQKLGKGTDPRPTLAFIEWALRDPEAAAKL